MQSPGPQKHIHFYPCLFNLRTLVLILIPTFTYIVSTSGNVCGVTIGAHR